MTIEFRCPGCNKLLRTKDETAGKRAKCPQCGNIVEIPVPAPAEDSPDLFSDLAEADFAPIREPAALQSSLPADSGNPYAAPQSSLSSGRTPGRRQDLASRGARFVGALVDFLIYFAVAIVVIVVLVSSGVQDPDSVRLMILIFMLPIAIVQWVLIATSGQSIGKKAVGTRIVNADTYQVPGFLHSVVLRSWVPALLGCVPLFGLVDALWIFGEERRCVHDLIASTRVVNAR